jgi:hypothetical protein
MNISVHKTHLNKRQTGRGTVDCASAQDIFTLVGNTTAKTGILPAEKTILQPFTINPLAHKNKGRQA